MTNLEKIKAAWAMGWSATIKTIRVSRQVVGIQDGGAIVLNTGSTLPAWMDHEALEITGYKYAGGLAGNEPIPKGQKFMIKENGEILVFHKNTADRCEFKGTTKMFDKSEIEPYFNKTS